MSKVGTYRGYKWAHVTLRTIFPDVDTCGSNKVYALIDSDGDYTGDYFTTLNALRGHIDITNVTVGDEWGPA